MIKGFENIELLQVPIENLEVQKNVFDECISCHTVKSCWYKRSKPSCYIKKLGELND